jgi:hypothetical protein
MGEFHRFVAWASISPFRSPALRARDQSAWPSYSKISECFQSEGTKPFANVRSYLDTARKHDDGALEALVILFRGEAWMPPITI